MQKAPGLLTQAQCCALKRWAVHEALGFGDRPQSAAPKPILWPLCVDFLRARRITNSSALSYSSVALSGCPCRMGTVVSMPTGGCQEQQRPARCGPPVSLACSPQLAPWPSGPRGRDRSHPRRIRRPAVPGISVVQPSGLGPAFALASSSDGTRRPRRPIPRCALWARDCCRRRGTAGPSSCRRRRSPAARRSLVGCPRFRLPSALGRFCVGSSASGSKKIGSFGPQSRPNLLRKASRCCSRASRAGGANLTFLFRRRDFGMMLLLPGGGLTGRLWQTERSLSGLGRQASLRCSAANSTALSAGRRSCSSTSLGPLWRGQRPTPLGLGLPFTRA